MGHTTDGMPQNLHKDTAFYREGENKHKKKCPFPQKKAKTIPKHHFRKLHLSTSPLPDGIITTPLFHIPFPSLFAPTTSLIPFPPLPNSASTPTLLT